MSQVVIVGGGCSGVLAGAALVRAGTRRVTLVEPSPRLGTGLAYGTTEPGHLLNSRAGSMSAYVDEPGHFVEWLRAFRPRARSDDFVERALYGHYLGSVLATEERDACARLIRHHATALRILPAERAVQLDDGARLKADHVILAIGQPASAAVRQLDERLGADPRYIKDPWAPGALTSIDTELPVLIVGTGLTAVDVVLSLAGHGHRGDVVAVSRHGLLPRGHLRDAPRPIPLEVVPQGSLSALIRHVRSLVTGADWRAIVDGLRPHVNVLWEAMPAAEQARFLRHVARYWECHRHRVAPLVADRLTRQQVGGRLAVLAGTVDVAQAQRDRLVVRVTKAGGRQFDGGYGAVVNCTGRGPLTTRRTPLVHSLISDGLARAGPHGLGLDVDRNGALVDRTGRVRGQLWTLGPPRLGRLWETTGVPEIRDQAQRLAALVVGGRWSAVVPMN
jgi:uncharacterized NAD(P)/FAD-binding protein YdhS